MRLSSLLLALVLGATSSAHAAPMKLDDYLALRGPAPTTRLAYGPAPSQYAELFVPAGAGPVPRRGAGARRLLEQQVRRHHPVAQYGRRAGRARHRGLERRIPACRRSRAAAIPACITTCTPRSTCWRSTRPRTQLDLDRVVASGPLGRRPAGAMDRGPRAHSCRQPAVPCQPAAGQPDRQPGRPGRPAPRSSTDQVAAATAIIAQLAGEPSATRPDVLDRHQCRRPDAQRQPHRAGDGGARHDLATARGARLCGAGRSDRAIWLRW